MNEKKSSLASDGSRKKILLADVNGFFTRARLITFAVLVLIYTALPLVKINGYPVILLDIIQRRFHFFGLSFNAQDFYLVFFILSGGAFLLFFITAVLGRVWCGWACPQTVFLEGIYRRIERWVDGPRSEQILRRKAPLSWQKLGRFLLKHGLYVLVTLFITHLFLSYFVSLDQLILFVSRPPSEHWGAFIFVMSVSLMIYLNFAWFREQMCLILCPYGRIQSALTDDDTWVIGYDEHRGEPRGKKSDQSRGDCIACNRCVDVCPTGIDIRNGLQLECIGCSNCIDACNDIMDKVGQKRGLIRYDSYNGFNFAPKRILRPRIYFYTLFLIVGIGVFSLALFKRHGFEANVMRLAEAPYVVDEGAIRNQFVLHLFNKSDSQVSFAIEGMPIAGIRFLVPIRVMELRGLEDRELPLFVAMDRSIYSGEFPVVFKITNQNTGEVIEKSLPFLGPATSSP